MTQKQLGALLNPRSIAVIGASTKPDRSGYTVMRNLLNGEFTGPIMPVTPKYNAVMGVLCYTTINALPIAPDLAIICTRGDLVPQILHDLHTLGTFNVIITAAGMPHILTPSSNTETTTQLAHITQLAAQLNMQILGPHSLGLIVPKLGLNASYAHVTPKQGKLAFVSQSSAICASVLDWAKPRKIGFSYVVSLGDTANINFANMLDYLARDSQTKAILLYVDSVQQGREFISAARAASFTKPVLVIKSGRYRHIERAASTDITPDVIYDAAFKRAGMLRVNSLPELFSAVETLANGKPIRSDKLTIVSNGFGLTSMAFDSLMSLGGQASQLSKHTQQQLSSLLPIGFQTNNPITLLGDTQPSHYQSVLKQLLADEQVDNLLVLHAPTAITDAADFARAIVSTLQQFNQRQVNVMVSWIGEQAEQSTKLIFSSAKIPSYRSAESAVGAFMHMVQYKLNQKLLLETPIPLPHSNAFKTTHVNQLITNHIKRNKETPPLSGNNNQDEIYLETHLAAPILNAYQINTVTTEFCAHANQLINIADKISYPVALKISSPNLIHKSSYGGIELNIETPSALVHASKAIVERVKSQASNADIQGFTIQKMHPRGGAHELRISVTQDPIFGLIITLGEGGQSWTMHHDAAVAFPPLNTALAHYLIKQAIREGKIRDKHLLTPIDQNALAILLSTISQILVNHPQIRALDINPLLIKGNELTVLDVSITLKQDSTSHLAIRPYPKELEEWYTSKSGEHILLRPILPEDEPAHYDFDDSMNQEDRYKRYFGQVPSLSHEQIAKMTGIDYNREMAFIATQQINGQPKTLGVVRIQMDPDKYEAEFAIALRTTAKGQGLGKKLLSKMIEYCQQQQLSYLKGITMLNNNTMVKLAKRLNFKVERDFEDGTVNMTYTFKNNSNTE